MSRRVVLGVVVGAMSLLIAGAGSATAHKRKFERQTTVKFEDLPGSTGDRVSGQVALGRKPEEPLFGYSGPLAWKAGLAAKCLSAQTVLIKHTLTAEGGGSDPPTLVATAITNATGAWQTTAYEASGANQLLFDSFQIEVAKKRLKPKNFRHKHVCIGAFANTTTFSY
jgi:hypothetical protein